MEKLIITCAITGAETTKKQNPGLPITPDQQAEAAYACWQAGASVIHLHVRDENGNPTQDISRFAEAKKKILDRCDVIVQFSTGGAVGTAIESRLAPLALKPEMASLNVGSINFGDEVFENLPKDIDLLATEMKRLKIKPEVEVYDLGMLEYGISLGEKGILDRPTHFQFVLGTKFGLSGNPENLFLMRSKIPPTSTFAVAGVGRHQLPLASVAIVSGGHVRVGLEDNIYFSKGVLARDNAELVARIRDLAGTLQRPLANTEEARKILGLI